MTGQNKIILVVYSMENQENCKLINDMINLQKPDKNVLSAAKCLMTKNQPIKQKIKKQLYTLASCSSLFILFGIIFAVLNQTMPNQQSEYINNENNPILVATESTNKVDNCFLIIAVTLISVGIILAVIAIILKRKKSKNI